jgi:hypothetical protein
LQYSVCSESVCGVQFFEILDWAALIILAGTWLFNYYDTDTKAAWLKWNLQN